MDEHLPTAEPISQEERSQRLDRLRAAMAERGVAAVLLAPGPPTTPQRLYGRLATLKPADIGPIDPSVHRQISCERGPAGSYSVLGRPIANTKQSSLLVIRVE